MNLTILLFYYMFTICGDEGRQPRCLLLSTYIWAYPEFFKGGAKHIKTHYVVRKLKMLFFLQHFVHLYLLSKLQY